MAAIFIDRQGKNIHDALGGPSVLDCQRAKFVDPVNYTNLASLLREYALASYGTADVQWGQLYEQIVDGEDELHRTDKNARQLFARMVTKLGEHSEVIGPFVDLIPNDYGLCVVKAGIALVLKYAEREVEKRRKIYDAFEQVRNAVANARALLKGFRTDPDVNRYATDLHVAIVDTVEILLKHVSRSDKRDRWHVHLRREKEKLPDMDDVLHGMQEKANNLKREAEARTHQRVGETLVAVTAVQASVTQVRKGLNTAYVVATETKEQTIAIKDGLGTMQQKLLEQGQRNENRLIEFNRRMDQGLLQQSLDAKNWLIPILDEYSASMRAEIQTLRQPANPHWQPSEVPFITVSPDQLLVAFLQRIARRVKTDNPDALLQHPHEDLRSVVLHRGHISPRMQAQAQSLLQQPQFAEWMRQSESELLFVDGNISSAPGPTGVSALSLLCAAIVANLALTYKQSLVLSFFCTFHGSILDPWSGPAGLLRSLTIQVLLFLVRQESLLSSRILIEDPDTCLESFSSNHLADIGSVLHYLLKYVPAQPDLSVFCVIDSVSFFDKDYNGQFDAMRDAMDWLQHMSEKNGELQVPFKALLTNPGRCTDRFSTLVDPSQLLTLNASHIGVPLITERTVKAAMPSAAAEEDEWDEL